MDSSLMIVLIMLGYITKNVISIIGNTGFE